MSSDQPDVFIYQCRSCHKGYSQASSVRRHMISEHKFSKGHCYDIIVNGEFKTRTKEYPCEFCEEIFNTQTFLDSHQSTVHEDLYNEKGQYIEFADPDEYKTWFENLQKTTTTSFFIRRSTNCENGKRIVEYQCHRQGSYESKAAKPTSHTTKKVVSFCPTFAKVTFWPDSKICVNFDINHSHSLDAKLLKLSDTDRAFLKSRIEMNMKDREIIEECRKAFSSKDKLLYVTHDDIRNVKVAKKMNADREHSNTEQTVEKTETT